MSSCRACGQENPEGFRFCGACGAELGPPATRREVRKTVTVVFCDVTGSTALGEQLDPEAMRRMMGRYFEEIRLIAFPLPDIFAALPEAAVRRAVEARGG